MKELSAAARKLLAAVDKGPIEPSREKSKAASELDGRMPVVRAQFHSETGAHVRRLESWDRWSRRTGASSGGLGGAAARAALSGLWLRSTGIWRGREACHGRRNRALLASDPQAVFITSTSQTPDENRKIWMRYDVADDGSVSNGGVFFDVTAQKQDGKMASERRGNSRTSALDLATLLTLRPQRRPGAPDCSSGAFEAAKRVLHSYDDDQGRRISTRPLFSRFV
jgi:hypothetical protein